MNKKANTTLVKIENTPTITHKQGSTDLPKSYSHTITKEKIFKEKTQFKFFETEIPCVEYLQTNPQLYLFAEDVNINMAKRFFAIDYKTIYSLSALKKFHLYEYFNNDDKLKLYLDIDIKSHQIPENINKLEYFDYIITKSINLMLIQLKEYGIDNPSIIVLDSNRENKLSGHIIFKDVVFRNIREMKFFIMNIESQLITDRIIDPSAFKKGGLRLLWNSKMGSGKNLEFYKSINYTYVDEETLFMDCLVRNVPEIHQLVDVKIPVNVKLIKKNRPKYTTNLIGTSKKSIVNHPISTLKKYVDIKCQ